MPSFNSSSEVSSSAVPDERESNFELPPDSLLVVYDSVDPTTMLDNPNTTLDDAFFNDAVVDPLPVIEIMDQFQKLTNTNMNLNKEIIKHRIATGELKNSHIYPLLDKLFIDIPGVIKVDSSFLNVEHLPLFLEKQVAHTELKKMIKHLSDEHQKNRESMLQNNSGGLPSFENASRAIACHPQCLLNACFSCVPESALSFECDDVCGQDNSEDNNDEPGGDADDHDSQSSEESVDIDTAMKSTNSKKNKGEKKKQGQGKRSSAPETTTEDVGSSSALNADKKEDKPEPKRINNNNNNKKVKRRRKRRSS